MIDSLHLASQLQRYKRRLMQRDSKSKENQSAAILDLDSHSVVTYLREKESSPMTTSIKKNGWRRSKKISVQQSLFSVLQNETTPFQISHQNVEKL